MSIACSPGYRSVVIDRENPEGVLCHVGARTGPLLVAGFLVPLTGGSSADMELVAEIDVGDGVFYNYASERYHLPLREPAIYIRPLILPPGSNLRVRARHLSGAPISIIYNIGTLDVIATIWRYTIRQIA